MEPPIAATITSCPALAFFMTALIRAVSPRLMSERLIMGLASTAGAGAGAPSLWHAESAMAAVAAARAAMVALRTVIRIGCLLDDAGPVYGPAPGSANR